MKIVVHTEKIKNPQKDDGITITVRYRRGLKEPAVALAASLKEALELGPTLQPSDNGVDKV